MSFTVKQLIDELQKIDDKNKVVKLSVNCTVTDRFHVNNGNSGRVYLSNVNEEGYEEPFSD